MDVSCQLRVPAALRPGKAAGTHWIGGSRPVLKINTKIRVFLEKLIVGKLDKKFPIYFETQRFVTVFTRGRLMTLP
jgi:hypothetical protein